ncbi:uncharacterized protein LOC107614960 [Arachis ipaensis]|uniref:uncharacterized protein LOC107614960 n=1 Tax=Arachis ipaensis TaxID=130454 RepID=UPI0007AF2722|nr:uncharacterized protein LOC107614960 [Arachis ipaensis]
MELALEGSIKKKTRLGIKFTDKVPLSIFLKPSTSFAEFKNTILQRLGLHGVKRVEKLFYRISISVLCDDVKYDSFIISSDEDMHVLYHCRRQFPEVRTPELLAKLVDVASSSGGSNRNNNSTGYVASSSALPVGSSSAVPVIAPEPDLVASPSFAVNLNRSCDALVGEAGPLGDGDFAAPSSPPCVPPATIAADDSEEETPRTTPPVGGGASSSSTNQYPPYFSALDLDAMAPQEDPSVHVGFGARDSQNAGGVSEFQVLESDNRKYYGKCKEFGSGCVWLIWVSLRQRKGIWEVKRYNGPHTCLATSISSDHGKLDYHVISAFIMPLIRAYAATSIKVLQNATEAHFGFRLTYRRIWMAKQKAVAQIYGDRDDSYNELPRWVLGLQITMPGSVAVLRTSPVRLGGQLDDSTTYFHRLFWTFPPCVEAFQHCKLLDGNSNIIPIAFALVEGENAESWSFFLSHLRAHVTPQSGILLISYRHNGIKATLEAPKADGGWLPPTAYRAFCIRHVAANFALTFNGKHHICLAGI